VILYPPLYFLKLSSGSILSVLIDKTVLLESEYKSIKILFEAELSKKRKEKEN
jgi:hypothetical protein